jgi:hypothetical protein
MDERLAAFRTLQPVETYLEWLLAGSRAAKEVPPWRSS